MARKDVASMIGRWAIVLLVAAGMRPAFAEWVADEGVEQAAEAWLSSDRVAQLTMKGLSFGTLEPRDSLRVVRLAPTGYIVMSGSDVSDPVISFSRNAYVEPEAGSPFYDMLAFSGESVAKREAEGGERTEKWTALIGGRDGSKPSTRRLLASSPDEDASTILIEPFVTTHWNQGKPWSDFCPLDDTTNRCPCGCVATATAQQIAHFKWPWRTGRQDTWVHTLDTDGKQDKPGGPYADTEVIVRFDGHEPFEWESFLDEYDGYWGEPRGRKQESERFAIARLVSWVDLITKMNFGKGGSGAYFGNVEDSTTDWYEAYKWYGLDSDNPEAIAKIRADFEAGAPVHIGVPGHAVVGHGLAYDNENGTYYLYLNYGWGGSNDGWYELYGNSSPIEEVFTGFRPKKMVQLETLPKLCDGEVEVKWHLPDFHKDAVAKFEVKASSFGSSAGESEIDFSDGEGYFSHPDVIYVTNSVSGVTIKKEALFIDPIDYGAYEIPGEYLLTDGSEISYKISSSWVLDSEVLVQVSCEGEAWVTISNPELNNSWSNSWDEKEVSLAEYAGKVARFRIIHRRTGGWSYDKDYRRVIFEGVVLSNVVEPEVFFDEVRPRASRECTIDGLASGAKVVVAVTPIFAGENKPRPARGYVQTRKEGEVIHLAPQILSVKGRDGMEIDENLYRELVVGEDELRVRCSPSVTSLKAYPSHLTYLADEDVTVEESGPGEFLVRMDTSKAPRRQRMILTLEAKNSNGDAVYRDVSLRFDEESVIAQLDRWRKIASFSGKPVAAYTFDNSDTSNSGTGDFGLYVSSEYVTYEDSPLGRSVNNKASDGPWGNWEPNLTNEWTILTIAKTSDTNNGVLFAVGVTWKCGFALVAKDENTVKIAHWTGWTKQGEITATVPDATNKFHAYAIRGNGVNAELYVDGQKAGEFTMKGIPDFGFKMFGVYGGANYVGLANGSGEAIDDWRMYYSALPDSAIAAYTATLMQFDEEPAGVAVEEGGTVVPESWFAQYRPGQTITRAQLLAKAANGRSVWECYVAGLDPTDEDDDLVADITFEDGVPKVSFANGEKSNRIYRIYATKSLDGLETPVDVTDVPDLSVEPYSDYRFFRISVELP